MSPSYTLVFDGDCRVCTRLAGLVRKWDRHHMVDVVPSQAEGVAARFHWIPPSAFAEAMQLIGPGGQTWQGAAATEQLLAILPRGPWIAWIFKVPLVRPIADTFYRWFARNRHRFGCSEHCKRL